jgi:hypothetical protein
MILVSFNFEQVLVAYILVRVGPDKVTSSIVFILHIQQHLNLIASQLFTASKLALVVFELLQSHRLLEWRQ